MSRHARVICADPPWSFGDKLPGKKRGADKHYKTMTVSEIMRHPLPPMMDDAVLFLWRVSAMPLEALKVCEAWGFTLKSEIVWVKEPKNASPETDKLHMGMGHYVRAAHETCLIATRGSFKVEDRGIRSVFYAAVRKHSEKPDEFYALVEKLCGEGPFVELFGRKARANWHVYGDEIPQGYVWTECVGASQDSATPDLVPSETDNGKGGAVADEPSISFAEPFYNGKQAVPPHVLADLGEHPMSTRPEVRKAFLVRAHAEKLIDASGDINEAWFELVFKAPAGWFCSGFENIAVLHAALVERGIYVTLIQVAGWSVIQRDVAQAWCEQMGDKPVFFPSLCAACDKGGVDEAYKHTGDGPNCRSAAKTAPDLPPPHPPPAGAGSGVVSAAERTRDMFEDL